MNNPIYGVVARWSNGFLAGVSDSSGLIQVKIKDQTLPHLVFSHAAYKTLYKQLRPMDSTLTDKLVLKMHRKINNLDTVQIYAKPKPEVIHKSIHYSVLDFEFTESGFIMLTTGGRLSKLVLRLVNEGGMELHAREIEIHEDEPAGLIEDYQGYINLVSNYTVLRVSEWNHRLMIDELPVEDYHQYLKPVIDSLHERIFFTDQRDWYPGFSYKSIELNDSIKKHLCDVSDEALIRLYRLEYYYLPSRMQLEARRLAKKYGIEETTAGAIISGYITSKYYQNLYAPLFVVNDTLCVFNHHCNFMYRYNYNHQLIDSMPIQYHHTKRWTDWRKKMFCDRTESKIYALFSRDGHQYIKRISTSDGKEQGIYKLTNYSAQNIRIKDGYVYYVYRPFGSTQEKYFYRELIRF